MPILEKKYQINSRYEIKHFIENTSFCEVYTVVDLTSKKQHSISVYNAAKISRDDIDSNGELREIGYLKMAIKGFPKYVDSGEFLKGVEKYRYIVSEFISGESVKDRIARKGPYDEFDAISTINQILDIVNVLHSFDKPILLNGLSLDNLMIDMSGPSEQIVIRNIINVRFFSDNFNCKFIDGVNSNYLAPEVFNNVFTPQSDIFNIGAIFYNLLCSTPPWYVELNPKSYFTEKSIDKIDEARERSLVFSGEFDSHLKATIIKSLAFDVDERFKSVKDFIEAIRREKLLITESTSTAGKSRKRKGNGFKDIAGMEELKSILQKEVIDVINNKEKYEEYGVTIPNGMLLYGPPGCGKTFISEKFAEEIGFTFISIKPSDLGSIYVHGAQEKIGALFADAEKNAPAIIFFDEVDAMMPKRGGDTHQGVSGEVNEFLAQMTECSKKGIFVIAATNQPDLIDDAILRTGRIDRLYYVANPDLEAREKMFELYLKSRPCEIEIDFKKLAKLTDWFVSSDIKYLIDQASRNAVENDVRISNDILLSVIKNFKPSVSKEVINKYLEIKNKLENQTDSIDLQRKPLGFQIGGNNKSIIGKKVEITHPSQKGKQGKIIAKMEEKIFLVKFDNNEEVQWERDDFKII